MSTPEDLETAKEYCEAMLCAEARIRRRPLEAVVRKIKPDKSKQVLTLLSVGPGHGLEIAILAKHLGVGSPSLKYIDAQCYEPGVGRFNMDPTIYFLAGERFLKVENTVPVVADIHQEGLVYTSASVNPDILLCCNAPMGGYDNGSAEVDYLRELPNTLAVAAVDTHVHGGQALITFALRQEADDFARLLGGLTSAFNVKLYTLVERNQVYQGSDTGQPLPDSYFIYLSGVKK